MSDFDRSESMRLTNVKRKAKSEAIMYFLETINSNCNLTFGKFSRLENFDYLNTTGENDYDYFKSYIDEINDLNRLELNSYRADQMLKTLGINFNKNKLSVFSTTDKQNKEATTEVLNTVSKYKNEYKSALDSIIALFIKKETAYFEDRKTFSWLKR